MTADANRPSGSPIHPLHAFLLAGAVPLFLGGLLTDIAYARSYTTLWYNFAAWLIAGAMIFAGFALLWALLGLLRPAGRGRRRLIYALVLLAAFGLGLVNSLVHAKDAWAVMPEGPLLSAIVLALSVLATVIGFSTLSARGAE